MSERRGHNHVSQRTKQRRYSERLTDAQSQDAKQMRDRGRSFTAIAKALGVSRDAVIFASGLWRDAVSQSGNAVLNIDQVDRDEFRRDHCLPEEAVRLAFKRYREEHAQLLAWAKATGFPGFSLLLGSRPEHEPTLR